MGFAYYIVLEHKVDGLDTMMDGKSLARHIEALDAAAQQLGVIPLLEFLSMPPEEAAEFLEEGIDFDLPPLKQFSAQDGLTTVNALLTYTPVHKDNVVTDLREIQRILVKAAEQGVRWHLQIDI